MNFTCPKGHKVTEHQLGCTVSLVEPNIDKAIIYTCKPETFEENKGKNWHDFTLQQALKANMFTNDQADRIRQGAREHKALYGGGDEQ